VGDRRPIAGRFEVREFLGRGGQAAAVYRAFDRLQEGEVAPAPTPPNESVIT
jgi:hypothetical protein